MKKYLLNRVLRSIFSIIMVMLLSVVLIFSFIPDSEIYTKDVQYQDYMKTSQYDKAEIAKLDALQRHGYIEYVSQNDYCESIYPDTRGSAYQTCVARLDTNEDKQNYLEKYRKLGWEEIRLKETQNCDIVTRQDVIDGKFVKQENQEFFIKSDGVERPTDNLYNVSYKDGVISYDEVVTYNNKVYFRNDLNPLKTFWNWLTGIIDFDGKNSVENYRQWNHEEQRYLYESQVYSLVFEYQKGSSTISEEFIYEYSGSDMDLQIGEISFRDKDAGKVRKYISIAGISTGVEIVKDVETVSIQDYDVVKKYNDENNHEKGGTLEINVTFSDGTTKKLEKEVEKYLLNGIPVYVSDGDSIWYIGNTSTGIAYSFQQKDWDIGDGETVTYIRDLKDIKSYEGEIERGYSIQKDEYGVPAVVCSGCEHKYAIYFDNSFPYIHFNFIKLRLGESIDNASRGKDITNIMTDNQGEPVFSEMTDLNGDPHKGSYDFHSCTYNSNKLNDIQKKVFTDNYTNCGNIKVAPSRIATSFIIGIFATLIAYFVGVPIGVVMARKKEKWIDKIGMAYIIVMFAVPSLAYIYFVKAIGTSMGLEDIFNYAKPLTYILPIISLSLGSIASMMMWTRRYIIDQENSDYVKFARAKGLSESQIFFKHILRNAIVPIAHGIPGSLIGAVAGAMVTERVYVVTGTGHLMVESIQGYNNWAAIGLIFFFTVLGIASLILGDVVITLVDPRISFADTGGRK